PVQPQNLAHNIPQNTNTSFDKLTAEQRFEILDKGTTDPLDKPPKIINQEPTLPIDIYLGLTFE
ncbi:10224_t:CDS:1, partial [Scutellospora calospora]